MSNENKTTYVPADTGPAYWGPGDRYTFLVTGRESGGTCFMLEALVPPGGGPPPHIHHREDEAFYLLHGSLTVVVGEQLIHASSGDFVYIPRGTVHTFKNNGDSIAKMLATFTPAGMEKWFEEVLDPVLDRSADPPPVTEALIARMIAAGPKHGVEWVI